MGVFVEDLNQVISAEELTAMLLSYAKQAALSHSDSEIKDALVTVSFTFNLLFVFEVQMI